MFTCTGRLKHGDTSKFREISRTFFSPECMPLGEELHYIICFMYDTLYESDFSQYRHCVQQEPAEGSASRLIYVMLRFIYLNGGILQLSRTIMRGLETTDFTTTKFQMPYKINDLLQHCNVFLIRMYLLMENLILCSLKKKKHIT